MDDLRENYEFREPEKVEIIRVEYNRPKFWHRVMANLVDIITFFVYFVLLFISVKAIVTNSSDYKNMDSRAIELKFESSLYIRNEAGEPVYVIDYLENKVDEIVTNKMKINDYCLPIIENTFASFISIKCTEQQCSDYFIRYDKIRLEKQTSTGEHYFIKNELNQVVVNESYFISSNYKEYYENIYVPFIDEVCLGYLSTYVVEFRDIMKSMSDLLLWTEIPISYCTAGIMTYLIPGLFIKRGRKTLGMALYHIGYVDSSILSPKLSGFIVRFLIFFFLELILSLFTFGIPFIVSFTMMAFSKKRRGFPSYIVGFDEIDTSKNKIYMSPEEAKIDRLPNYKKPIDFRMKKEL